MSLTANPSIRLSLKEDHKNRSIKYQGGFLEAIDDTPYPKDSIGRLEFAKDLLRDDNPFTTRVIVNRLWHHLFGNGLVRTTYNFGKLGELPYTSRTSRLFVAKVSRGAMVDQGNDQVSGQRRAFRASSNPSPKAIEIDPQNFLLSHANLRRLEAEAIRDAMLLSGRLQLSRVAEGNQNLQTALAGPFTDKSKETPSIPFFRFSTHPYPLRQREARYN